MTLITNTVKISSIYQTKSFFLVFYLFNKKLNIMKYILFCLCLLGTQLYAQTTQPAEKQPVEKSPEKVIKNGPNERRLRPNTKPAATDESKIDEKQKPMTEEIMLSDVEKLNKFGIADSEKNALGGLKGEEKAPNFSGVDQHGDMINLADMVKEGEVVVFFYRGYWCGICNRYLAEMESQLSKITDKGAKVVAITSESNEFAKKTSDKNNLSFSVISDKDASIMRDYKVLFETTEAYQKKVSSFTKSSLEKFNDSKDALLPIPATYIIDKQGKISYVHYSSDYSKRASVEEIVKYLK